MHRSSLLLLGLSGCLVQDPQWEPPPAESDATQSTGSGATETDTEGDPTTTDGTASGGETTGTTPPTDDLPADCSALGGLPDDAIIVGPEDNDTLHTIVEEAPPGATIALSPGQYDRSGQPSIVITSAGLTLRSTTGDPAEAVLDGGGVAPEPIVRVRADDVTLAEFKIHNSADTLIEVGLPGESEPVVQRPHIYRMELADSITAQLDVGAESGRWTDDGVVACSTFHLTDPFRDTIGSCSSVSGIRISGGVRWIVRDNEINGLWCTTPTYAVLAADLGSRDTRIERNVLRNNFRGILLGGDNATDGRPEPSGNTCGDPDGDTWGHVRGEVVNNVIWVEDPRIQGAVPDYGSDVDAMISFWHVCAAAAIHNTSYVTVTTFSGIEWRYTDTAVTITNNVLSTTLEPRQGGIALGLEGNAAQTTAAAYVNADEGDFRLVAGSAAIDAGVDVPGFPAPVDFAGQSRVGRPDLGAFEFQP